MKTQALTLFVFVSIWSTIPFMMEVAVGVPLGRTNFFLKQCFEFCQALGQSRRALGARRKKGIEREVGGYSGRVWLTSQCCLGSTLVGNMNQAVGGWYTIVLSHKGNWQMFFPLLFCDVKYRVYPLVQLLNIIASCSQEEINFMRHRGRIYAKLGATPKLF